MGPPGPLPPGARVFDAGGVGAGEKIDGVTWPAGAPGPLVVVERKLPRVGRTRCAADDRRARHRIRAFAPSKALRSCYDVATARCAWAVPGRRCARADRGGSSVSCSLALGCAHAPRAERVQAPPPPPKPRVKLAVLPVDTDAFPQIAASLNRALHDVKVKGVDDYFLSKVTLEVVQLSIECVQPTSECYSAVGKSLSANKLLLGHIARHRQAEARQVGARDHHAVRRRCRRGGERRRSHLQDAGAGVAGRAGSGRRGGRSAGAHVGPESGPANGGRSAGRGAARWRAEASRERGRVPELQQGVAGVGGERAAAGGGALRGMSDAAVVVERARDAQRQVVDGDDDGDAGGDRRPGEGADA